MVGDKKSVEGELVAQIAAGSRSAFDKVAREHAPRLLAMATRMLASKSEAEEAVQIALASVWVNRHRLKSERPVGPYLTTVVLNKCRDKLRRRKAASFLGRSVEEAIASDLSPNPEQAAGDRQELAQVRKAIERLPVKLREALTLVSIDGRSQREAATLLGVTEKTIETRVYRARNRLRETLDFL